MNAICTVTAANATPAAPAVMFERKPLADALAFIVKRAVEARNTIPITGSVLIEAADDGARVTGTDLDLHLSTIIPAAWDVPGAFAIDARAALAAVKAATGDMVTIDATGRVSDGTLSSRCTAFAATDFPAAPAVQNPARFALDAATLALDIDRVRPCVSTEETRYYLNGIFMHVPRGAGGAALSLDMAATDGHRLAHIRRDMPAIEGELSDTILPRKSVDAIRAMLGKKPEGAAAFAIGATAFVVEAGGWRIRSKVIDGTFPHYTRVIPAPGDISLTVDGDALAAALRAVTVCEGKKGGSVKLVRVADGCSAEYRTAAMIDNRLSVTVEGATTIAATWQDNRREQPEAAWLAFDALYLAPMALALGGVVTINAAAWDCPAIVTTPDMPELRYVLMPKTPADIHARRKAGTIAPAAAPVVKVVETAGDVFRREYREAFERGNGPAMGLAVARYRATGTLPAGREHDQIRLAVLAVQRAVALAADKPGRVARLDVAVRVAARRDRIAYTTTTRDQHKRAFARIGADMRAKAAHVAWLESIPGYRADDARDFVPVVTVDGKRRFVKRLALLTPAMSRLELHKADGNYPRGKYIKSMYRTDIARIVPDRAAPPVVVTPPAAPVERVEPVAAVIAPPAPVDAPTPAPAPDAVDVAALVATVTALAARVAELEAASVAPAPAPVAAPAAPVAGDDGRDAYIATLIAERDALRIERDTAVAEYEAIRVEGGKALDARDIATRMVHGLLDARKVTAGRMRQLRTASRTAASEARHAQDMADRLALEVKANRVELARLRPLAAAIAAFTAPAAPVDVDPFTRHGGQPIVAPATVAA